VDLLLTPHRHSMPGDLAKAICLRVAELGQTEPKPSRWRLAYNDSYVVGEFTFKELFCALLPLTGWYQRYLRLDPQRYEELRTSLISALQLPPGSEPEEAELSPDLIWLARVVGIIEAARNDKPIGPDTWAEKTSPEERKEAAELIVDSFLALLEVAMPAEKEDPSLWLVNMNRRGHLALWRSRETVKADVAERTFSLDFSGLRWAIIDSGIDATHPAFRRREESGALEASPFVRDGRRWVNQTRILKTYDFTRLRELLAAERGDEIWEGLSEEQRKEVEDLEKALLSGRSIAWDLLSNLVEIRHDDRYPPPKDEHGTHVAGLLAGDWRNQDPEMPEKHDLRGVCPTLELFDFRVFDEQMGCDEFSIIGALQFVRFLNSQADQPVIHGVNISISMVADVHSYACGRTPVCEECERLVNNGVVVVVAAGNAAYQQYLTAQQRGLMPLPGFQDISVTDPGNAEGVITVGATHRIRPHTYGVSYFSSRGPTADGRRKPDLVAPGEKIVAPVLERKSKAKDGTSMAAPHVSGAAAVLMARHRGLIGQPTRVKRILMDTATDLGRDQYFQGAGLVDIFRALQSV